jgi:rhodanese-related sulfurtransferase
MIREKLKRVVKKIIKKMSFSSLNLRESHLQEAQDNDIEMDDSYDNQDVIADDDPILDCELNEERILEYQNSGKKIVFIDIRESYEYRQGYIENALMIPMNHIPKVQQCFSNEPIKIIYCAAGIRSFDVCVYLRQQGIENVFSMEGGVGTWAKHSYVYPEESQYHFYVGQIIEIEEKYIVQHIFQQAGVVKLTLMKYQNNDSLVRITEMELHKKISYKKA